MTRQQRRLALKILNAALKRRRQEIKDIARMYERVRKEKAT